MACVAKMVETIAMKLFTIRSWTKSVAWPEANFGETKYMKLVEDNRLRLKTKMKTSVLETCLFPIIGLKCLYFLMALV